MLYYKYALQVRAQKCLVLINEVILIISKFQNFLVCYWTLCIHNEPIFDFHIYSKSKSFNNLFVLDYILVITRFHSTFDKISLGYS